MSLLAALLPAAALAASSAPAVAVSTLSPVERGFVLYGRTCAVCHGAAGEGYKADRATALSNPDFLAIVDDAFLREAIVHGRAGTTMSAWGEEHGGPFSGADVAALIAYIRTWDKGLRFTLDESPAHGDAAKGAVMYEAICARCHGAQGRGGPETAVGGSQFLASAGNGYLRRTIESGRPGTPMPAFGRMAGPGGLEDLISYLRSLGVGAKSPPPPLLPPAGVQGALPLGPVPLNPDGPEPEGFLAYPGNTGAEAVKAQLDRGAKMAFLDARAPADYATEHIAGAVSVPFYAPEPYFAQLPKDAWLVCYCACPHAESGQLATKLMSQGFTKVTVLAEGIGFWRGKNYPVRKGKEP